MYHDVYNPPKVPGIDDVTGTCHHHVVRMFLLFQFGSGFICFSMLYAVVLAVYIYICLRACL